MKVQVYWNIAKKVWSVRDKSLGRVVLHLPSMVLENCVFKVQRGGRARVLRERQKNIHAFVEGTMDCMGCTPDACPIGQREGVTYNPYKHETFVRCRDGSAIHAAPLVVLTSENGKPKVFA